MNTLESQIMLALFTALRVGAVRLDRRRAQLHEIPFFPPVRTRRSLAGPGPVIAQ